MIGDIRRRIMTSVTSNAVAITSKTLTVDVEGHRVHSSVLWAVHRGRRPCLVDRLLERYVLGPAYEVYKKRRQNSAVTPVRLCLQDDWQPRY